MPRSVGGVTLGASRFGAGLPQDFSAMTCTTVSPSFFGGVGVVWRKFVAMLAVGASALSFCSRKISRLNRRAVISGKPNGGHDLIIWKPLGRSLDNGVCLDATKVSQFDSAIPDAMHDDKNGPALVALLFLARRPSAVIRAIVPIVVATVKRCAVWAWPHIGNKAAEIIPLWANGNPASPVILPLAGGRGEASAAHGLPNAVKRVRVSKWHWLTSGAVHNHPMAYCLDKQEEK